MNAYTTHHLKHASAFAMQTEIMKERFLKQYPNKASSFLLFPMQLQTMSVVALP